LNTLEKFALVREVAEQYKAQDLVALDVRGICTYADVLVLLSGTSSTQIQSLAEALILASKKAGSPALGWEGMELAQWCLIDLGDIIVHIFTPETRAHFELDALWAKAPRLLPPSSC
jgi:ribosome-associated protein